MEESTFSAVTDVSFENLLQMYSLERKTLIIEVIQGNEKGEVFLVNGEVYHAQTRNLSGEKAFYKIQSWKRDKLNVKPLSKIVNRSINKTIQGLLLESAKLDDEMKNNHSDGNELRVNKNIQPLKVSNSKETGMGEPQSNGVIKEAVFELAASLNFISGVLAVAEDGSILSESGIDDLDTTAGVILFVNACGRQVGEMLNMGKHLTSLVQMGEVKLLTMKLKNSNLGIFIDSKTSVVQTVASVRLILEKRGLI